MIKLRAVTLKNKANDLIDKLLGIFAHVEIDLKMTNEPRCTVLSKYSFRSVLTHYNVKRRAPSKCMCKMHFYHSNAVGSFIKCRNVSVGKLLKLV